MGAFILVAMLSMNYLLCQASYGTENVDEQDSFLGIESAFIQDSIMIRGDITDMEENNDNIPETRVMTKNFVENMLYKFLEKVKQRLAKSPPVIAQVPIDSVEFDNIKLNLKLKNVKIFKAEKLNVEKIRNRFYFLTEFKFSFPELTIEGDYETDGQIGGSKVSGKGYATVWLKNLITWGKIYCNFKRGRVNIYRLNLDYSVEDLKAKLPGLKVEGKSEEEVEEILKTKLLPFANENEAKISSIVARAAQEKGNEFLRNYNIKSLIKLIQNFKP